MKVILIENVNGKGNIGDIIDVPQSYANFLISSKKAKKATKGSLQDLKNQESSEQRQLEILKEDARLMRDKINNQYIDIKADGGPSGMLHECITSSKIGSLLEEKFKVKVDKRKINIDGCEHGIKSLGNFSASVEFFPDISANIFINVN